jgi:AP-4 complex subunit epsilon-1
LTDVDPSIVELYFSQRLEGLDRSAESYEDEVLALLEVIKILAGEDAELYARSVRDVLSPLARAEPNAQRSSQVLERAVENVLSSLRDGEFVYSRWGSPRLTLRAGWPLGETTFGENVATTLLTPLAEVEADTSFSPTLMVVLTALACEYAGHVPVSPLQLLCGLGRRLRSFPRQCIRGIHRFHCFLR